MAIPRVTSEEVQRVLDGLADGADVTLFIEQANMLVNEEFANSSLTTARLRMLELNLAAHFAVVALERGGLTQRRIHDTEERYANTGGGSKLSSSRFGQQAVALDPTGKLSQLDSPKGRAEFRVV